MLAQLIPVPAGKGTASPHTSTTTTAPAPLLHGASASTTIATLGAGRSVEVTLPALTCQPGERYVLRIRVGTDVESFTLQVAAG